MNQRQHDEKTYSYIVFYKPYGVLSQFTDSSGRKTLSDFGPFPRRVYPVGRLDADSEGLLLLTDNNALKHVLLDPLYGHTRTYLVQVERQPTDEELERLRSGVLLEGKKTRQSQIRRLKEDPQLPPREVPIRFRKNVDTAWLEITLTEGRNRQVRKMTAAVGHPTLRLVRIAHGPVTLANLNPGEHRHLTEAEIHLLLRFAHVSSHRMSGSVL